MMMLKILRIGYWLEKLEIDDEKLRDNIKEIDDYCELNEYENKLDNNVEEMKNQLK